MLELLTAVVKPKLIGLAFSNLFFVGLSALWLLVIVFAYQGYRVASRPDSPTIPELQQHLEFNDGRLDKIDGDISKRLDRLEDDRRERREVSDARYKKLGEELDGVKHDVTFIYGGGIIGTTIVSLLLTLNVVRVKNTEVKIDRYRPSFAYKNQPEDLETARLLRDYLSQCIENGEFPDKPRRSDRGY